MIGHVRLAQVMVGFACRSIHLLSRQRFRITASIGGVCRHQQGHGVSTFDAEMLAVSGDRTAGVQDAEPGFEVHAGLAVTVFVLEGVAGDDERVGVARVYLERKVPTAQP